MKYYPIATLYAYLGCFLIPTHALNFEGCRFSVNLFFPPFSPHLHFTPPPSVSILKYKYVPVNFIQKNDKISFLIKIHNNCMSF